MGIFVVPVCVIVIVSGIYNMGQEQSWKSLDDIIVVNGDIIDSESELLSGLCTY